MFKVGVLASTNGTDLQAIYDEMDSGKMPGIEVSRVVSNVSDCGAVLRSKTRGVPTIFVDPNGKTRLEYDQELVKVMGGVDLVCLIGYMRILTPVFIQAYRGRILNVHPALLPQYGGKGFYGMKVHEAVLANREKETGMTVHFVDEEVDSGPILLQKKVPVSADDTPESLKLKVQELEKKAYPEAIRLLAAQKNAKIEA